jgi:hypothetical protein
MYRGSCEFHLTLYRFFAYHYQKPCYPWPTLVTIFLRPGTKGGHWYEVVVPKDPLVPVGNTDPFQRPHLLVLFGVTDPYQRPLHGLIQKECIWDAPHTCTFAWKITWLLACDITCAWEPPGIIIFWLKYIWYRVVYRLVHPVGRYHRSTSLIVRGKSHPKHVQYLRHFNTRNRVCYEVILYSLEGPIYLN